MGELLSVKVSIGNRSYPLRVTKEEEEKVTAAAQTINNRMKEIEESYAVKDKQDLLAMSALQFASEALSHQKTDSKKNNSDNEVKEQTDYLCGIIDECLSDKV